MDTETDWLRQPRYLFGAGAAASWVLQGFRREGLDAAGFLDDAAERIQTVGNLPVHAPDGESVPPPARSDSVVILTVMNSAIDEKAVASRLQDLGWGKVVNLGQFGRAVFEDSGIRCGMLDARLFEGRTGELAEVRALLDDDHSLQVFDSFVAFVISLDDTGFPPVTSEPYFPDDVPRWPEPLRMLDLGAFDGDTLRAATRHGYRLEAAIGFEPDPDNFPRLAQTVADLPGAMALPLGVSGETRELRFASQGDAGSYVSEAGGISIQVVKLDEAIPHFGPNLIKLDIEGSEESALRGAEGILRRYRPALAVSLYHCSTDIWQIPLFLKEIYGADATYLLRRHSRTIADTVLYVYPQA